MTPLFIIGITGGSGSGKTLLLDHIMAQFSQEQVCLISQDNYYKDREDQPLDELGVVNFDTEHSLDTDAFADDIQRLRRGEIVKRKEYTFNNPSKTPNIITFHPAPVIVVEGLFIFHYPQVAALIDLKVFIDAKAEIRLSRRIRRDAKERGYDLDDVLYRYQNHHSPVYDRLIEPLKHEADLIIPNNKHFKNAVEVLIVFIKHLVDLKGNTNANPKSV